METCTALFAVAREPVEVQLVGDNGYGLDVVVAIIGPLLIALAAVVAAFVAAHTANRRQRAQLDHDLEVRHREYVRDVLDSSVELARRSMERVAAFKQSVEMLEGKRFALTAAVEDPEGSPSDQESARAALGGLLESYARSSSEAGRAIVEMSAAHFRLGLALGLRHDVAAAFETLGDKADELVDSLSPGLSENRSEQARVDSSALDDEVGTAFGVFMARCEEWLAERPRF